MVQASASSLETGLTLDAFLQLSSTQAQIKLFRGDQALPVLTGLDMVLSAAAVFDWLVLPN